MEGKSAIQSAIRLIDLPNSVFLSHILGCFKLKDTFRLRYLCKDLHFTLNQLVDFEIMLERKHIIKFE